jgi:hypothetical protein
MMSSKEYLSSLSDDELREHIVMAKVDLTVAAEDSPESEWHQACFAGLVMLAQEASKRGLTLASAH